MKPHASETLPGSSPDAVRKRLERIGLEIARHRKESILHLDIDGSSVMLVDQKEVGQK